MKLETIYNDLIEIMNDNIIEKDNYVIGTIKDLKEYFRYQIARQCMSGV